ncbi:MAG: hypothetical protein AB8F78_17885 [Saprospiraceae bacterium]
MQNLLGQRTASWFLFFLLSGWWCHYLVQHPGLNWDVIAYMGAALERSVDDPEEVHRLTYEALKQDSPAGRYKVLTQGQYRKRAATDATFFVGELGKYRIKPLYVRTVAWLHGRGVPLVSATVLPSALGVVLLSGIFFAWVSRFRGVWIALAVTMLLMVSNPMWTYGRFSTPDLMSAPWIMLAFCLLYFRKNGWWVLCSALVATAIRTDNGLLLGLLILYYVWSYAQQKDFGTAKTWASVGGAAILGLLFTAGLATIFMGDPIGLIKQYSHVYSSTGYPYHLSYSYTQFAHRSSGTLITAVALMSYMFLRKQGQQTLVLLAILVAIRVIILPLWEERFFVGYEWACLAIIASSLYSLSPAGRLSEEAQ